MFWNILVVSVLWWQECSRSLSPASINHVILTSFYQSRDPHQLLSITWSVRRWYHLVSVRRWYHLVSVRRWYHLNLLLLSRNQDKLKRSRRRKEDKPNRNNLVVHHFSMLRQNAEPSKTEPPCTGIVVPQHRVWYIFTCFNNTSVQIRNYLGSSFSHATYTVCVGVMLEYKVIPPSCNTRWFHPHAIQGDSILMQYKVIPPSFNPHQKAL